MDAEREDMARREKTMDYTHHNDAVRRQLMNTVKSDVFDWLEVSHANLNEIELEDIKLERLTHKNIHKTVAEMMSLEKPEDEFSERPVLPTDDITCKGYWVENTIELVLYVWIGDQSRAIIVPQDGWNIREDIIIH
jgi:hypothetical protein